MKHASIGLGIVLVVLINALFSVFLLHNQDRLGVHRPQPTLVSFDRRAVLKTFVESLGQKPITKEGLWKFEADVQAQLEKIAAQYNVVIIADLPVIAGVRDITGHIEIPGAAHD